MTALAANVVQAGGVKSATLGARQSAVLFVNARFARREDVPARLVHRVAATDVTTAAPLVLGPPLLGDRWVAAASCCDSYHRRAVLPIDGARHLAQRYAIDWIRMAGPSPPASNGAPYGIDAFAVSGKAVSSSDLDAELKHADRAVRTDRLPAPAQRRGALPADLAVVAFPEDEAAR